MPNHSRPLSALLLLTFLVPAGAGPLAPAEVEASLRKVGDLEEVIRGARDVLPRADLDIEERALALGMDAPAITAWVRDEVRLDAYPGVLRGPEGTLLARAGNAWDQALLTAALLRTSGLQARVVHAELDVARATTLLAGLGTEGASWEVPEDAEVDDLAAELDELGGQDAKAREAALAKRREDATARAAEVDEQTVREEEALTAALARVGVTWEDARARWIEEARDYAWVQYRRAQGDTWSDAHPAFPEAPEDLEPAGFVEAEVPEDRLHQVEVRLVLERSESGKLRTENLMSAWRRPVANLGRTSLRVTLAADGFRRVRDVLDAEAAFRRTRWFRPMLDDALAPRARVFDRRGFAVAPDAAANPMAQIFSTMGDHSLKALDALSGTTRDGGPGARELTAVWLEVEVSAPGGASRTHRRYFLDRIGTTARAAGRVQEVAPMDPVEMASRLHRQVEVVLLAGDLTPFHAIDQDLDFRAATLADIPGPMRQLTEVAPEATLPVRMAKRRDPRPAARVAEVGAAVARGGSRVFRSGPGVFLLHRTVPLGTTKDSPRIREQLDVMTSPRRGVASDAGGWRPAPEAVLAAGVRETVTEARRPVPEGTSPGTSALAKLSGAGPELVLVRAKAELGGRDLPASARAALAADLGRGFVALLRPGPDPAWWRVDPSTGEATGVTADGAGSAAVEYWDIASVALNIAFTGYGVSQCETSCCVVTTVLMGTTLTIGGLAIGADLAGKAAWAFLGIMDVGVNTATAAIIPPPCND
jgi:hypothetical protein